LITILNSAALVFVRYDYCWTDPLSLA